MASYWVQYKISNNINEDKITSVTNNWSQILRYTFNILLVKFQMGKFNIRLIFVIRENMFVKKCTFVWKCTFLRQSERVYLFLTLNNRKCFNSKHIRFIKSTNFTRDHE